MTNAILPGKVNAESMHLWFDEGKVASAKPKCGTLFPKRSGVARWIGVLLVPMTLSASDILFVDKSGADGAYRTIQDAVDAAEAGATIFVRPGIYDEGGKTFSHTYASDDSGVLKGKTFDLTNRVYITKSLTLQATSSNPADTHIVGARDLNPIGNTLGIGPAAVRCIYAADVNNVVIKGFTIRDGASQAVTKEGDCAAGYPGSVVGYGNSRCYLVDCVVSNCVGTRASSARSCTAVRTLFSSNVAMAGNDFGRGNNYFHCVFRGCASYCQNCKVVNCTFVDNLGQAFSDGGASPLYNSIISSHFGITATRDTAKNNVVTADFRELSGGSFANNVKIDRPIFAPLVGDYRPLAGSGAEMLGNVSWLKAEAEAQNVPESVEVYKSMDGVTIDPDSSELIAAGAFQTSATAATGAITYANAGMVTEGCATSCSNLWAYSETSPRILVSQLDTRDRSLFSIERSESCGNVFFPDDETRVSQPFPPVGVVVTNSATFADVIYYVAPDGVDDAEEAGRGLSATRPFKTLQYVVDRLTAGSAVRCIVHAASGLYEQGESSELFGHRARVAIDRKRIRILGAGERQSTIIGCEDTNPSTRAVDGSGRGANAMRCVAVNGGCVQISGFTIKDGFSGCDLADPTSDGAAYSGGLVRVNPDGNTAWFEGCCFEGGRAYRGTHAVGGTYNRCRFTAASVMNGGLLRQALLYFCQIDNITMFATGGVICDSGCSMYGTTIVSAASDAASAPTAATSGLKIINSILVGRKGYPKGDVTHEIQGTVLSGYTAYPVVVPGECEYVIADPIFVDVATDDYRVGDISAAVTASVLTADWWKLPVRDYDGRLMTFRTGKPVAGAFQYPVQTVVVAPTASYPGAAVSNVGTNFVEAGESLTIEATAAMGRPIIGFVVNGETIVAPSGKYVVTAPIDGTLAPVSLSVKYQTDWFVNADKLENPGDGLTAETAKGTLAAVMLELPVAAGDTVHVARGVYRDGTMSAMFTNTAPSTILSRVVVPAGVTLLGDEGAEVTVIEGSSPLGSGARYSENAIRCVSLCKSAVLKGVTLLGGQTAETNKDGVSVSSGQDDGCGGGVLIQGGATTYVYDCVITNCCACRGGGVSGTSDGLATYVNCRFVGNAAGATSTAAYYGRAYGCFFDSNGTDKQVFRYCGGLVNCTLTEKNGIFADFQTGRIDNSIVLVRVSTASAVKISCSNTVYATFTMGTSATLADEGGCTSGIAKSSDAGLDATGRPVKGGIAVDKGDFALIPASLTLCSDAAGGQRVYNGTVDIGCFERDWRDDYANDLGGAGVVVNAADPSVVEKNGRVFVKDGCLDITLVSGAAGRKTRYTVPVTLTGSGTLTALLNDEELIPGDKGYVFRNALAENHLLFSHISGTSDDGGAIFGVIDALCPGIVLIVR